MLKYFSTALALVLLVACKGQHLDAAAIEACDNAAQFVEKRARLSGTSKIGPCSEDSKELKVIKLSEQPETYEVSNYFDAQNGFGPSRRQTFVAKLERVDGGWKLADLSMAAP